MFSAKVMLGLPDPGMIYLGSEFGERGTSTAADGFLCFLPVELLLITVVIAQNPVQLPRKKV